MLPKISIYAALVLCALIGVSYTCNALNHCTAHHHLPVLRRRDIPSKCYDPPRDDCSFYRECVEARYHCGPDGYPLGYGEKYCTVLSDNRSRLSGNGQQFLVDAMRCLQLALVPDATGEPGAVQTCDELKEYAYLTHPKCYVDSGFCRLPVKDWAAVMDTIGVGALVSGLKQELETGADCLTLFVNTYFDLQKATKAG